MLLLLLVDLLVDSLLPHLHAKEGGQLVIGVVGVVVDGGLEGAEGVLLLLLESEAVLELQLLLLVVLGFVDDAGMVVVLHGEGRRVELGLEGAGFHLLLDELLGLLLEEILAHLESLDGLVVEVGGPDGGVRFG